MKWMGGVGFSESWVYGLGHLGFFFYFIYLFFFLCARFGQGWTKGCGWAELLDEWDLSR